MISVEVRITLLAREVNSLFLPYILYVLVDIAWFETSIESSGNAPVEPIV